MVFPTKETPNNSDSSIQWAWHVPNLTVDFRIVRLPPKLLVKVFFHSRIFKVIFNFDDFAPQTTKILSQVPGRDMASVKVTSFVQNTCQDF